MASAASVPSVASVSPSPSSQFASSPRYAGDDEADEDEADDAEEDVEEYEPLEAIPEGEEEEAADVDAAAQGLQAMERLSGWQSAAADEGALSVSMDDACRVDASADARKRRRTETEHEVEAGDTSGASSPTSWHQRRPKAAAPPPPAVPPAPPPAQPPPPWPPSPSPADAASQGETSAEVEAAQMMAEVVVSGHETRSSVRASGHHGPVGEGAPCTSPVPPGRGAAAAPACAAAGAEVATEMMAGLFSSDESVRRAKMGRAAEAAIVMMAGVELDERDRDDVLDEESVKRQRVNHTEIKRGGGAPEVRKPCSHALSQQSSTLPPSSSPSSATAVMAVVGLQKLGDGMNEGATAAPVQPAAIAPPAFAAPAAALAGVTSAAGMRDGGGGGGSGGEGGGLRRAVRSTNATERKAVPAASSSAKDGFFPWAKANQPARSTQGSGIPDPPSLAAPPAILGPRAILDALRSPAPNVLAWLCEGRRMAGASFEPVTPAGPLSTDSDHMCEAYPDAVFLHVLDLPEDVTAGELEASFAPFGLIPGTVELTPSPPRGSGFAAATPTSSAVPPPPPTPPPTPPTPPPPPPPLPPLLHQPSHPQLRLQRRPPPALARICTAPTAAATERFGQSANRPGHPRPPSQLSTRRRHSMRSRWATTSEMPRPPACASRCCRRDARDPRARCTSAASAAACKRRSCATTLRSLVSSLRRPWCALRMRASAAPRALVLWSLSTNQTPISHAPPRRSTRRRSGCRPA